MVKRKVFVNIFVFVFLLLFLSNLSIFNQTQNNFKSKNISYTQSINFTNNTQTNSFRAIKISETGLPVNYTWYISTYENGNTKKFSSISPSNISLILLNNSYNFSVYNITINNTKYIPKIINKIIVDNTSFIYVNFSELNLTFIKTYQTNKNISLLINNTNFTSINQTKIINSNSSLNQKNLNITSNTLIPNNNYENGKNLNITYAREEYNYSKFYSIRKAIINLSNNYNKSILIENISQTLYNQTSNTNLIINSPTAKIKQNVTNNNTVSNTTNLTQQSSPAYLNITQLINMSGINQQSLNNLLNLLKPYTSNKTIPLSIINISMQMPYGNFQINKKYLGVGTKKYFIAYNNYNSLTIYNISFKKAQPKLNITVNGLQFNTPNTTAIVHIPILNGQKKIYLSGVIKSNLINNNMANFNYYISINNKTISSGSNYSYNFNKNLSIQLNVNETASISFSTTGNNNYSAVDPTLIIIPTNIIYTVPITITNSQNIPTPSPFQQMLNINSSNYISYESGNLDNIEFFYQNGTIIPSWLEGSSNSLLNNPTNSINLYKSTNTTY
ncbi:MAG: hypothetical protein QXD23_02250, partial [Candidatus Micrarchaeaceae archaeon]